MSPKVSRLTLAIDAAVKQASDSPLMPDPIGCPVTWEARIEGQLYRVTLERVSERQVWRGRRAGTP